MHTADELCLIGKRQNTCTRLHANTHAHTYGYKQAQCDKYDIHVKKNPEKSLFLASPEGIACTRRAGLEQDVGITASI